MRLEEILPEIRKGVKFRQLGAPDCHYQIKGGVIWVGDQWKINIDSEDLLADDWELVPEKRKHSKTVYLWSDGEITTEPIPIPGSEKIIESRVIEWEVE